MMRACLLLFVVVAGIEPAAAQPEARAPGLALAPILAAETAPAPVRLAHDPATDALSS